MYKVVEDITVYGILVVINDVETVVVGTYEVVVT